MNSNNFNNQSENEDGHIWRLGYEAVAVLLVPVLALIAPAPVMTAIATPKQNISTINLNATPPPTNGQGGGVAPLKANYKIVPISGDLDPTAPIVFELPASAPRQIHVILNENQNQQSN